MNESTSASLSTRDGAVTEIYRAGWHAGWAAYKAFLAMNPHLLSPPGRPLADEPQSNVIPLRRDAR